MEEPFDHIVYSKNVIEFVTVAREYVRLMENLQDHNKQEFVSISMRLLPLLYLKTLGLPGVEPELQDAVEKVVTEEDYNRIKSSIEFKLGRHNDYLEVFTPDINRSEEALSASIAEDMADIYQDIRDFIENYKTAVTELMNDALSELATNFELVWGQKVVNCLRALHNVYYGGEDLSEDEELKQPDEDPDTRDWIFSRRQREWGLDEPDLSKM